ncbi:polysaccharide deacetylase family protein [Pseudarthrobacter sp. PH31-O2]|uniref:polysaccharide deacetylase family protein n=1 Tax=Pseudarthrobacter sp. PH31-O2 TaxID=3046206 RepID=UPI0024BA93CC|nr:polysaccharide deacetylase family protein [Pseudarthrobacter sp. PH31-O2]MDJ0352878.1 polysaccharide deacetylase family protein [Pseudarthrobacter sp. PH31-O2]
MWPNLSGRRRWLVAAAAVLLLAAAVVLAVVLRANPPAAAPTSPPPASSAPASSPVDTAGPSEEPPGSPTPGSSPSDAPVRTPSETAPAGPVPLPAIPAPEPPPPPAPEPPPAPFPAALAGRDLEVVPGVGAVVALTFDAGANAAGLPSILQTLATTGVRGTFFLTGNWAAGNPAGVAAIVAGGHRVGNHSMTHPGFTGLPDAAIGDQLVRAQQAILAGGGDPRPLFRFPFGERDARTIAAVNAYGYVAVRWSVDTLGWKGSSGGISARIVADRTLAGLQPGEIVLMHIGSNPDDGTTLDADALPGIIDRIRQAGYGFTTLDSLLG